MSPSVLTHLECADCGARHDRLALVNLCACGGSLMARYDLHAPRLAALKERLSVREADLWRYAELLPDPGFSISLGEGFTPLIAAQATGRAAGCPGLLIKDESANPTGSFKDRGLSVAVAMAKALGAKAGALPSAGNAGSAAAAFGARARLPIHVFLPADTPRSFFGEVEAFGAVLHKVDGHIGDAGRAMRELLAGEGWFDLSTLKEPYRVEGKKTMGYEVAEQLGWTLPDAVLYPTGGGTGLIGMWKAFEEMETLGWIAPGRRPRMYAVQSQGCAPVVRAFEAGKDRAEPWADPKTAASGIRVPAPFADRLILRILRESGGGAVAVQEGEIAGAAREIARHEGILPAPEGAACLLALSRLLALGAIAPRDRVVLFNTGTGLKYPEALGF
ncbi:MAG TPA: threonine synthase [Verrucomicrobiae bacterium]|nr:threonine synthase [Verrucomicrobiae bacterium]